MNYEFIEKLPLYLSLRVFRTPDLLFLFKNLSVDIWIFVKIESEAMLPTLPFQYP